MELVEAEAKDTRKLKELWFSLAREVEEYSELNEIKADKPDEVSGEGFREHIESEEYTELLVKEEGELVGFVTIRQDDHPSRKLSEYTEIVNLLIGEEYRSQGLGSSVIEKIKEIARERNSDYLKVSSEWKNNGARKFYRENGFKQKQVTYTQKLEGKQQ